EGVLRSRELWRKTCRHINCVPRFAVSKHAIRIPPLRVGRRVRWTFEVSADVGAENTARAKKTSKKTPKKTPKKAPNKRQRARPTVKRARISASRRKPPVVPESAQPSAPTPTL